MSRRSCRELVEVPKPAEELKRRRLFAGGPSNWVTTSLQTGAVPLEVTANVRADVVAQIGHIVAYQ